MKLTFSTALNLLCANVLSVELKKVSMFRLSIPELKFSSLRPEKEDFFNRKQFERHLL